MSNKKINIGLPLLFAIAVIIGMFVGYKLHSNMPNAKSIFSSAGKNKMGEVLELVRQRYVDQVNIDSVSEIGIEKVLSALDPHSVYIPISSLKEINEDLEGQFEGIGVEFNIIRQCPSGSIIISGFHVAYSCGHFSWSWASIVGSIYLTIN